ncbi:MAG: hypothetical protein HKN68_07475 [Saprospiraceae bacterium]|nr:hypothetical protein [Saprospiraceae bacterium]
MNINYPLRTVILTGLLAIGTFLSAQDKSTIILINSVPYNVLLSNDGEIKEIRGEAVGHMKGYVRSADEFDIPAVDRTVDIVSTVEEGSAVRSDRSMVTFETNYATLADDASGILDKVVDGFNNTSGEKIMISAFKSEENEDDTLYTNRIKTIRTYFELKGIPVSKIITEVVVSSALKDKVSLTYIQ